jgi:hypothetical protein
VETNKQWVARTEQPEQPEQPQPQPLTHLGPVSGCSNYTMTLIPHLDPGGEDGQRAGHEVRARHAQLELEGGGRAVGRAVRERWEGGAQVGHRGGQACGSVAARGGIGWWGLLLPRPEDGEVPLLLVSTAAPALAAAASPNLMPTLP